MKKVLVLLLVTCIYITSQAQVVINEVCPDPGNYDGQGAEWTELFNTTATAVDLSCWILTDGEEIVVLPAGTYIPANGYLVVYNSNFFNPINGTGNWYNAISNRLDNNGTLTAPDPDGVTSIDLATCGCSNQTGCFAVTWDNPSSPTGTDRIVLFNANAVIQDAVYYGNGDNYAAAAAPILENNYAIGANTANRNITGAAAGCNLPASNNYDIPALPAQATSNAIWEYIGGTVNGCTTSKTRLTNGGSVWADDNYPTPGASNTNADYKTTYTLNGGAPVDITTQDAVTLNVCSGATLSFNGELYDYNQVYNTNPGDVGMLEGGSTRGGSHVVATGGLNFDNSWVEAPVTTAATIAPPTLTTDGMTALSYPTIPAITANTTFRLFIKENTAGPAINANTSCGGGNIVGSGTATECYILKTITVNVVVPITTASFTCANGLVKVNPLPSTATGLTYNLINSATPALNQTNTTGQFQITSGTPANYSVQVVQTPACGGPITATGSVCVFAPACPTFTAYDACASAAGPICPGGTINLSLTGTNLPDGAKIEWVNLTGANTDAYAEPATSVITSQNVTVGGAIPSGTPRLNEVLFNATTETSPNFGEGWEVAGTPGTNIGCSYFTDGDFVVQLPSTAVIPASGFYVVGTTSSNMLWSSNINLQLTSTSDIPNLTNGGEFLAYFSPTNSFINGAVWGSTMTASNIPATSGAPTVSVAGSGCSALPSFSTIQTNIRAASFPTATLGSTTDEQSIELSADLGTTWQLSAAPGSVINTLGSSNAGNTTSLSPTCVAYTVPTNACNTPINIKPRISPAQAGCTGGSAVPTLATRNFSITCPTAAISGQKAICSGSSTNFDVALTGFGTNTTATVTYLINGAAPTTTAALPISNSSITVPNITAAGIYTLSTITFGGGTAVCAGSANGDVTITLATNPTTPTTTATSVCDNVSTPITVTDGGPSYNWYSNAGLTTLVGVGNPYYYTGTGTTLYVTSTNPDNGCTSTASSVAITSTTPPTLTIPATIDCNTGFFTQAATGGTGALNFTLAGKTGSVAMSSAIGTTNTSGTFNLSGSTGATILVTDANGCYNLNTYDFLAAPYNCGMALTLQFTNFNATLTGSNASLTWQVAQENNVLKYQIERSLNGAYFTTIATINKNTANNGIYTFTDVNITAKKYYYRVKAIDNANVLKYSTTRMVAFNTASNIGISPNPATNAIAIALNNIAKAKIEIFNINGSLYYRQTIAATVVQVNVAKWASGTYTVKVTNVNTMQTVISKFIKN